jgi:hypothetical protein
VLLRASRTARVDLIDYDDGEVVRTGLLVGDAIALPSRDDDASRRAGDRRGHDARTDRGGEARTAQDAVRMGAPLAAPRAVESLGYEPQSVSIDFRGPLL